MAISNRYTGFVVASSADYAATDNDSDFGVNLNRNIQQINRDYSVAAGVRNTFSEGYINQFGASSRFSTNEQRLVQNLIRESININGITVRYMPRWSPYNDEVWNERPESTFHRGYQADMILVAAAGFEGEGDVMTQYGIEFREEVILSIAIPRFSDLDSEFKTSLDSEDEAKYGRTRPLEGDLIVIPFGRSAQNREQYVPKVFEISRVTTYHDGAFFQLGDNYQYKIRAKLFELSGEDLEFNPTVVEYNDDGTQATLIDSETGPIARAKDGIQFTDSETRAINIVNDSEATGDSWADNRAIEERAQVQTVYDDDGDALQERQRIVTEDYTARAFGLPGIIDNLDDI